MKRVEQHFDEWSKDYSNIHFIEPYFEHWMFARLIQEIDTNNNPAILDLGTGDGRLLIAIAKKNPHCTFIGVDISEGMLKQAKENFRRLGLKGTFSKVDMNTIPLKDNSVDYVVSSTAIHHVKNKNKLFTEIFRVLKPKGKLLVIDQSDLEDEEYKKLKHEFKIRKHQFWERFVKSFDETEEETQKKLKSMKAQHPPEYHVPPFAIKRMLEKTGFSEVTILPTPKFFVMYFAVKR